MGRKDHAAAEVNDFEDDNGAFLAKANLGGGAAGMALDIGETFLNDAEQGEFDRLGQAAEFGKQIKLRIDRTALRETVSVFAERGDEAQIVEQGGMEEIRKRADFAGHLLGEGAGFFESANGFFVRRKSFADLGEAEIDSENGLRKTVVKLPANAAAFFVLQAKELIGKLADGAFGAFHFGDIGKRSDDANDVAGGVELWNRIAESPQHSVGARTADREQSVGDRGASSEDGSDGVFDGGDFFAVFGQDGNAVVGGEFANRSAFGNAEHAVGRGIGELDTVIGAMKDNGNVEIMDESTEQLFAFAKGFRGTALLSEIGKGNDHTKKLAGSGEFGDDVKKRPDHARVVLPAPANELAAQGLAVSDHTRKGALRVRENGAVLAESGDTEFRDGFAENLFRSKAKKIEGRLVGENDAAFGVVGDDADVKVLHQRAEAFLASAKDIFGFLAGGYVTHDDQGAGAGVEFNERGGHQADTNFSGLGAETKLDVANVAGTGDRGTNLGYVGRVDPEVELGRNLANGFFAGVTGEASESLIDFEVRTVGKDVDAESIRTRTESGGKHFFGAAQGLFGAEKVVGDDALFEIGENEANGGTDDRSGDGKPTDQELLASDTISHEDDEERKANGKKLESKEVADASRRRSHGSGFGLLPADREHDDYEIGTGPEHIGPGDITHRSMNGKEIAEVRKGGGKEKESKNEREGAEGREGARAK